MFCSDVFSEWYLSAGLPFPLAAVRAASRTRSILRPSARDRYAFWIRSTCAATLSITEEGHADGLACGTKCGSGIPWIPCLRMWILVDRCGRMSPTRRYGPEQFAIAGKMLESPAFHEPNRTRKGFPPKAEEWGYQNRFCFRSQSAFPRLI